MHLSSSVLEAARVLLISVNVERSFVCFNELLKFELLRDNEHEMFYTCSWRFVVYGDDSMIADVVQIESYLATTVCMKSIKEAIERLCYSQIPILITLKGVAVIQRC
jgi:hypothetical protein